MSSASSLPKSQVNESDLGHSTKFRFKRKRDDGDESDHERNNHRHRHHHRHHRRKRTRTPNIADDPAAYDDSASNLPPDTAFRESLFDALGDDEGAAFWQGVYGQPIHNYPNSFQNEETGELEQLDDEEYATYVRRKMWEKSWEGIEAAKEQRRQQNHKEQRARRDRSRNSETQKETSHDFLFDLEIDRSLKRGEQRRDKKKWKALWQEYLQKWADLQNLSESRPPKQGQMFLRNMIPWPVESGKRKDVDAKSIGSFLKQCADALDDDASKSSTLANMLKTERVRFHPDKIQQRYGFLEIDPDVMQSVTAVFQVVDQMWSELRNRSH